MHVRLPVVVAIVVVAAGVAVVRNLHRDAPPATGEAGVSIATAAPERVRARSLAARASAKVTVYVAGEVVRAGVYALPPNARAVDALRAAGGAASDADLVAVNLAEPLADGEEIVVPARGVAPAGAASASGHRRSSAHGRHARHRKRRRHRAASDAPAGTDASGSTVDAAPTQTVDINKADESELETLPGIGASLAARIVTFREINGPFGTPDDLLDVGGMTQGRLDAIAPYVTAE